MTEKYFEEHDLIFEGAFRVGKGEQATMHIHVWGPKGRFFMKMLQNGKLYCQSKDKKRWILIEKY